MPDSTAPATLPRTLATEASALAKALTLTACTNIGPETIERDRFDYNTAISDSWKQQTLLNIVKLRYADMPVFVEVVSVVSGYQLEGSLSATGSSNLDGVPPGDFVSFGATGKYIDRPTITYQPITGSQFNKSFMTPIPPQAILFLLQTGWPANLVFPLTVEGINGLRANLATGENRRKGDYEFYRLIEILDQLRKSGAVSLQVRERGDQETTVLFFHRDPISEELRAAMDEFFRLLDLDPTATEFTVTYGNVPRNRREIAISTVSMLHILIRLSGLVDVSAEDVAGGRTLPTIPVDPESGVRRPIQIHQAVEKPSTDFVAVRYRDRWFWVEDGDFTSKRSFTFLMILFSLTETGGRADLPLVTIPAN